MLYQLAFISIFFLLWIMLQKDDKYCKKLPLHTLFISHNRYLLSFILMNLHRFGYIVVTLIPGDSYFYNHSICHFAVNMPYILYFFFTFGRFFMISSMSRCRPSKFILAKHQINPLSTRVKLEIKLGKLEKLAIYFNK